MERAEEIRVKTHFWEQERGYKEGKTKLASSARALTSATDGHRAT